MARKIKRFTRKIKKLFPYKLEDIEKYGPEYVIGRYQYHCNCLILFVIFLIIFASAIFG